MFDIHSPTVVSFDFLPKAISRSLFLEDNF